MEICTPEQFLTEGSVWTSLSKVLYITRKAMGIVDSWEKIEQEEIKNLHRAPCYNHDNPDIESQLLIYRWEKWLKIENDGRKQIVLHRIFLKPEWQISPGQWIDEVVYIPHIPSLRAASMLEMYNMVRSGDPFLSDDTKTIAYISSSKEQGEYRTWFPSVYQWHPCAEYDWGNTLNGHQLAIRCLIDIPPLSSIQK